MGGNHLYDCDFCAANPYFYSALGHDGKPQGAWENNLVNGAPFARCPKRELLEADAGTLHELQLHRDELYPLYRAGHLPRSGGALDQPARSLDYFRTFDQMRKAADAAYARVIRTDGDADPDAEPPLE